MKVKIYYHHTDCGGVVYYANYLNFLEEARTEFFAENGLPLKTLSEDRNILFVVSRQELDYKFPAYYADILEIGTKLTNIGNVRLEFEHRVNNQNGQLICQGKVTLVCVGKDFKPQAISEDIRNKLE
ncbi:MAG: YbgC/FadM family acyl-CoA thioesterase [Candidatus Omnitrophota bacterium]|nr:YbgC/FadM family acyl-CoA thioesterase [Candidatus Omnitrophota bacterium]